MLLFQPYDPQDTQRHLLKTLKTKIYFPLYSPRFFCCLWSTTGFPTSLSRTRPSPKYPPCIAHQYFLQVPVSSPTPTTSKIKCNASSGCPHCPRFLTTGAEEMSIDLLFCGYSTTTLNIFPTSRCPINSSHFWISTFLLFLAGAYEIY